jgi:hypothetical protein
MMFISPSNGEIVTSTDVDYYYYYYGIMDDLCNWGELGSSNVTHHLSTSTGISIVTVCSVVSSRSEESQIPMYLRVLFKARAAYLSHAAVVVYECVQCDKIGSTFGIGVTSFARGFAFVSWNVLCYIGKVDASRITIYYPLLQWKDVNVHAPSASLQLRDGYSVGTYQVVKKYPEFMLRDVYGPSDVIGWGAVELLSLFIGAMIPTCIADGEFNIIVLIGLTRILRRRYHRVGTIYLHRLASYMTPHLLLVDELLSQDALWGDIPAKACMVCHATCKKGGDC